MSSDSRQTSRETRTKNPSSTSQCLISRHQACSVMKRAWTFLTDFVSCGSPVRDVEEMGRVVLVDATRRIGCGRLAAPLPVVARFFLNRLDVLITSLEGLRARTKGRERFTALVGLRPAETLRAARRGRCSGVAPGGYKGTFPQSVVTRGDRTDALPFQRSEAQAKDEK